MLGGKKSKAPHMDTLVGHSTKVTGDLHFENGLHVDGLIVGNALAEETGSRLSISERGCIEGEVRVPVLILNGTIKGDVYVSERLELGQKARVEGDVYYNLIRMEAGATVNGKLVHKPADSPMLALKHDKRESGQGEDKGDSSGKSA